MSWLRRLPLLGRLFGPKLAGPEHRAAVDELVKRFRRFGLLTELETEEFLQEFMKERRRPFDPDDPWDRAVLAHTDTRHVWMDDVEADVCAENRVYCEFLRSLAAISQGSFDPQGIDEIWETDTGPITVAFTLAGVRHELHPAVRDDWMDVDILTPINTLLSTHQFACWAFDQVALVACLPRDVLEAFENSDLLQNEYLCR